MHENRRKPDGYITRQKIDDASMVCSEAERTLERVCNYPELSTGALRDLLSLRKQITEMHFILIEARNGK